MSGRVPDKDTSELLPTVSALDKKLDALRKSRYQIAVTGLLAIAARSSVDMIDKLSRGLTIEFLFVAAFIGFAFRSVRVALAAFLPGIFPIVAAGALLAALGEGLQFASVAALTVSFGLGLSATIHFLNRMRREGLACAPIDHVDRARDEDLPGGSGLEKGVAESKRNFRLIHFNDSFKEVAVGIDHLAPQLLRH